MIALLPLLALVAGLAPATPPRPILTLEQALATAREHQPQILAAAATTRAAQARVDEAHAPLLPQVSGVGTYQRATANFVSRPGSLPRQLGTSGGSESLESFGYFNAGLNANYLLFDFGQSRARWHSAEASYDAQRDSQRTTESLVRFDVRTAFFQARADRELVAVARDTLANQRKHLDQTQGFVDVGTQAPIALAQAKTGVSNAQVQLINAENGYDTAKAQLNQAMGVEDAGDYDVADETLPPVPLEDDAPGALFAEALKARPEIASLADQVRAQELTVQALRGGYRPSLGLNSGATDAGAKVNGLTWNLSAALQVSVPIFTGGLTKAQVARERPTSRRPARRWRSSACRCNWRSNRRASPSAPPRALSPPATTHWRTPASSSTSPRGATRPASAASSSWATPRWPSPAPPSRRCRRSTASPRRARSSSRPWAGIEARPDPHPRPLSLPLPPSLTGRGEKDRRRGPVLYPAFN
jgi:outer membrane protein